MITYAANTKLERKTAMSKGKKAMAAKAAETAAVEPAIGKRVEFTPGAWRFYMAQSEAVKAAFGDALAKLEADGRLAYPQGKAIAPNLYEIRVKVNPNQYRLFYCYFDPNGVLVLSGFVKKTQKAPQHEIEKAKRIRSEALK